MSASKTLFLVTKTYPFGKGEQYITNEINALSLAFNKVIIYPNDYYNNNTTHSFNFPNNVEVLNLNQLLTPNNKNKLNDYCYLLKQLILEFFATDDKRNFFKNFKWNLINFYTQLKLSYCFATYLTNNNYNATNAVFYSYWFHKSAIILSILKSKKCITKFVSRAHSIDLYHNKWGIINENVKVPPFKNFKLRYVDEVFCVSNHGTQFLKNEFKTYSQKITTRYLGVNDVGNDGPYKIENNTFNIVTCSGFDANKRVHELAKALQQIKQPLIWTHFGDGKLRNCVELEIKKLPNNITVNLMGNVPNNEVKLFYTKHKINLFVNLSVVEGLPVSIMEAMMFGIPIIATSVYGTPEAVIDTQNGFLIAVNFTQTQLINKIEYCILNQKQLATMGKVSRELFLTNFNAQKNYSEFANYLASL